MKNRVLTSGQLKHELRQNLGYYFHTEPNRKVRRQALGFAMPNTGNRKINKARKNTYMFIKGPKIIKESSTGLLHKTPGKFIKLIRMMNLKRI